MNKILKLILAIVGAVDVVFSMIIPVIIAWLWIAVFGWAGIYSYLFIVCGGIATVYRAIKIGFLRLGNGE